MAFVPRPRFPFPATAPSWYIGHMHRAVRRIQETLNAIDLVLEVRDARLPLTSINPAFENLFGSDRGLAKKSGKKRLIVYNRRDLAEPALERPIQRALLQHAGQLSVFTDSRNDQDVRHLLQTALKFAHADFPDSPSRQPEQYRFMIAGMPNVGKSSLLNALRRVGVRRGKAQQTGMQAGTTRKLTGTVRVWDDPPTYIYDTPGIMVPYLGNDEAAAEKGIKLALSSGLKESLYDSLMLADFLLYKINLRYFNPAFVTRLEDLPVFLQPYSNIIPTNDIQALLHAIATRMGFLQKGGVANEEYAARAFITAFREGKLGLWALDDMGLLFTGAENLASLPEPNLNLPAEKAKHLALASVHQRLLPDPATEESLALVSTPGTGLPAILDPNSPTSLQVSTFVSAFFDVQHRSSTELSTSKNQVKKRALAQAVELRRIRWRARHPQLVRSSSIGGRGRVQKPGGLAFYIGGAKALRKLERKRIITRKVERKRKKRKTWT